MCSGYQENNFEWLFCFSEANVSETPENLRDVIPERYQHIRMLYSQLLSEQLPNKYRSFLNVF